LGGSFLDAAAAALDNQSCFPSFDVELAEAGVAFVAWVLIALDIVAHLP